MLQQDILLYWKMGGERIQRKLKKFKGKQLAGKCTEPERNNKEKGSEWKMESNFLNKKQRDMQPKDRNTGKKKNNATQTTEQQTFPVRKREIQFDHWTMCKPVL